MTEIEEIELAAMAVKIKLVTAVVNAMVKQKKSIKALAKELEVKPSVVAKFLNVSDVNTDIAFISDICCALGLKYEINIVSKPIRTGSIA